MNEFHMRTIEREKAPHQQDAEICFASKYKAYREQTENIAGAPIQLHNNQQID